MVEEGYTIDRQKKSQKKSTLNRLLQWFKNLPIKKTFLSSMGSLLNYLGKMTLNALIAFIIFLAIGAFLFFLSLQNDKVQATIEKATTSTQRCSKQIKKLGIVPSTAEISACEQSPEKGFAYELKLPTGEQIKLSQIMD